MSRRSGLRFRARTRLVRFKTLPTRRRLRSAYEPIATHSLGIVIWIGVHLWSSNVIIAGLVPLWTVLVGLNQRKLSWWCFLALCLMSLLKLFTWNEFRTLPIPRREAVRLLAILISGVVVFVGEPNIRPLETRTTPSVAVLPPTSPAATTSGPLLPAQETKQATTKPDPGSLTLGLTPHVIVRRYVTPNVGTRGANHYGLGFVLRGRNTTLSPKQVQRLEISGQVAVRCDEYAASIDIDGRMLDEINDDCLKKQPYFEIRWQSYPIDSGRLEERGDEQFIRFKVMDPEAYRSRMSAAPSDAYLGFWAEKIKPKRARTAPNLQDIITFASVSRSQEFMGPSLRPEIAEGKLQIIVIVDDEPQRITVKNIRPVRWTLEKAWETLGRADLFYGPGWGWERVHPVSPKTRHP